MRYRIYQLTEPYGETGECLYETEDRMECMRKVAELIKEGESAATIKVITDYEPNSTKGRSVWRYYY